MVKNNVITCCLDYVKCVCGIKRVLGNPAVKMESNPCLEFLIKR